MSIRLRGRCKSECYETRIIRRVDSFHARIGVANNEKENNSGYQGESTTGFRSGYQREFGLMILVTKCSSE